MHRRRHQSTRPGRLTRRYRRRSQRRSKRRQGIRRGAEATYLGSRCGYSAQSEDSRFGQTSNAVIISAPGQLKLIGQLNIRIEFRDTGGQVIMGLPGHFIIPGIYQ
jgi:hypothetical protein